MTETALSSNSSTFLSLIRAIASQAVVFGHTISWCGIFKKIQPPYLPYPQAVAVVVFFMLSGFLIPYSIQQRLKQNTNYTFKQFFIDRFARIYSSYIPCLILILAIDGIIIFINSNAYPLHENYNAQSFFGNMLMLQNFPLHNYMGIFNVESFGTARPFWTLALEWWIYMWFGYLFLVLIIQKKINLITLLIFVIFSIVPFYNFYSGMGNGVMVPWLAGTLILLTYNKIKKYNVPKELLLLLLPLLLFFIFKRYRAVHFEYVDVYFVILLSVCFIITMLLIEQINISILAKKIINFFADYSFTLYLMHYTAIMPLLLFFKDDLNPYIFLILALLISNVVSFIIAKFTENKYKLVRVYLTNKLIKTQ